MSLLGELRNHRIAFRGAGARLFTKASPIYSWYALYVVISECYLFTSLYITIVGKELDVEKRSKLPEASPITDSVAPTVDVYLPVCKEPLEILENTWNHIATL